MKANPFWCTIHKWNKTHTTDNCEKLKTQEQKQQQQMTEYEQKLDKLKEEQQMLQQQITVQAQQLQSAAPSPVQYQQQPVTYQQPPPVQQTPPQFVQQQPPPESSGRGQIQQYQPGPYETQPGRTSSCTVGRVGRGGGGRARSAITTHTAAWGHLPNVGTPSRSSSMGHASSKTLAPAPCWSTRSARSS